ALLAADLEDLAPNLVVRDGVLRRAGITNDLHLPLVYPGRDLNRGRTPKSFDDIQRVGLETASDYICLASGSQAQARRFAKRFSDLRMLRPFVGKSRKGLYPHAQTPPTAGASNQRRDFTRTTSENPQRRA